MNLVEKYRPRRLADLLGQPWVVKQLTAFVGEPHSCAWLFDGETGTGKTTTALLLGEALGVAVANEEFGGLWQIASGEQTGESVRRTVGGLWSRPWMGSGWRMLIVNEADAMTANASIVWLDVLENLPPQTVIVFTTNHASRLPSRFRDRCETLRFESSALLLRPALQELAELGWAAEVGGPCPDVSEFGPLSDEDGNASFRRLLQTMTPHVRNGQAPAGPAPAEAPVTPAPVEAPTSGTMIERAAAVLASGPKTCKELALALGKSNVSSTITNLVRAGRIESRGRSVYALCSQRLQESS
jgi:hypothetical protein